MHCTVAPCLVLVVAVTYNLLAIEAAGINYDYSSLISKVDEYCYSQFITDPSCCLDVTYAGGVSVHTIRIPGNEWYCDEKHCWDGYKGPRGDGALTVPHGANCKTPRILYVHGGSWEYGSPFTDGYPQLATKIANLTGFVVYTPDYTLAPVGNYTTILNQTLAALDWLAKHGPVGDSVGECPLPVPPLIIGGDSSGGGSALAALMAINRDHHLGPYGGKVRLAAGFFFSPWTNLKCNTPDYYHHAFAKIVTTNDEGTNRIAYVGDLMFRGHPLLNKDAFTGNALDYVGGDKSLLTDPIASPLYTDTAHWQDVPPLFFAVGGSESILGDSVLFAQKAAHHQVEVQLEIFEGMWHVFPMYSEGCGSNLTLWQGVSALRRMAKFAQSVAYNGRPACSSHPGGADGSNPYTEFHYNNPEGDVEWFETDDTCAHLDPFWNTSYASMYLIGRSARNATTFPQHLLIGIAIMSLSFVATWMFASNLRLKRQLQHLHSGGYLCVDAQWDA